MTRPESLVDLAKQQSQMAWKVIMIKSRKKDGRKAFKMSSKTIISF